MKTLQNQATPPLLAPPQRWNSGRDVGEADKVMRGPRWASRPLALSPVVRDSVRGRRRPAGAISSPSTPSTDLGLGQVTRAK